MKPLWQYFDDDGKIDMTAFKQDGLAWIDDVQRRDAVQKAEREVLEACVKWACHGMYEDDRHKLIDAAFRYRALLDAAKAEGKEA